MVIEFKICFNFLIFLVSQKFILQWSHRVPLKIDVNTWLLGIQWECVSSIPLAFVLK